MPGQRGGKRDGHREALLRNSLDSSSLNQAEAGSSMVQPSQPLPRQVEADPHPPLPNTIGSGQVLRLDTDDVTEIPAQSQDLEGTQRHGSTNLQSPTLLAATLSPAPSPARLGPRQQVGALHPLSPTSPPSGNAFTAGFVGHTPVRGTSSSSCECPASGQPDGVALAQAPEQSCAPSVSGRLPLTHQGSGGFAPECRICLLSEPLGDLVVPCHCTGSLAYAHMACLRTWVMEKRSVRCELCGGMYKEPYGSDLAASIPPAPPQPQVATVRRLTTADGQPIIIMPVGVDLGPNAMGNLLHHQAGGVGGAAVVAGVADPRDLEPQPLCEWRNMWSYALILLLLLFAIIYVTVISKRGKQEPWMMTLWQVLLVVLPIYLVLRVAFDLYRHRLAQQLAAANLQAMAIANAAADAAAAAGHPPGGPREVIITRAGNRLLVLQRAGP